MEPSEAAKLLIQDINAILSYQGWTGIGGIAGILAIAFMLVSAQESARKAHPQELILKNGVKRYNIIDPIFLFSPSL